MMQTQDGKWKPAKVTGVHHKAPYSYFITTPQGQCYRKNRKHLRKTSTNTEDYLDDEWYDGSTTPVDEASQNIQMSNALQPTQMEILLRCSQ